MKFILSIVLLNIIFTTSCCTKKECVDLLQVEKLILINYSINEIDSIILSKSSVNEILFDDIVYNKQHIKQNSNYLYIELPIEYFDLKYDYNVQIMNTNKFYTLRDFKFKDKQCNVGLFCYEYYKMLGSFKIDNITTESIYDGSIHIIKK